MRCFLVLFGIAFTDLISAATADTLSPNLKAGQSILHADQTLTASGWQPAPEDRAQPFEYALAGNSLSSLASCSGTGVGFCRYDYRLNNQKLVVVTIPANHPDHAGRVYRWWMESLPINQSR